MAKKKKQEFPKDQLESQKSIGSLSKEAYLDYGNYVNNHRHICRIQDGMKLSYRRLIWGAMQFPKGKDIPTSTLISSISAWHPHGLTGVEELNANLTHSGIFSGEGSFGSVDIDGVKNPHAAPRYTKNRLSDLYWEIFGDLVKEVGMVESPVGALEPKYICLPIPLCLFMKNQVSGLGVAVKTDYPSFSPISLYNAYINNDPTLLEPNVNLYIDKNKSELERLWKTGKGRIIYSYKISRQPSPDGKTEGILFEGDTGIFTPKLDKFRKLEAEGKVYIDNMTDFSGPKLFIGRVPGARGITIDDIELLARSSCYSNVIYSLNVSDGQTTFRIPLYDWLDFTYRNYIELVEVVNKKKIQKLKFDISVLEALPAVSSLILQNPLISDVDISTATGLSLDIIAAVTGKPISYLRKNKDTSNRIKELKSRLKELKKFDSVVYTESIIKKL